MSDLEGYEGDTNMHGTPHGQGVMVWPNGDRYEGEWREGKRTGQGVYEYANGNRYEGQWKDGESHGQGLLKVPFRRLNHDGVLSEDEYVDDLRVWEGEWNYGQIKKGIFHFSNEASYEGGFQEFKFHGKGVVRFRPNYSQHFHFVAVWQEGLIDQDTITYHWPVTTDSDGAYEGQKVNGKAHGTGKCVYQNGDIYEGEWANGKRHGSGSIHYSFGSIFEGKWKYGNRHGKGTLFKKEGGVLEGEWSNGALVKAKSEENEQKEPNANMEKFDREKLEYVSQITGRRLEDLIADLADDGILNFSSGSDSKTKDGGLINSSRFVKVRKLLAEGGMAEVYQGKDKQTGEQIIWKQAAPSRKLSAKEANRALANEAEVLERLDHPRIPDYIESGYVVNEEGDRVMVLIMEHIVGGSLDDEMKTFVRRGMMQNLGYVIETVAQCCEALEHMADMDPPLYHRDIKPHNIMTHPERGVVLIDFGLAKEVSAGSGMSLSAGAHTAGWSPPERERAQTGSFTDVYSLGQVLWHMLTNEPAGIYSEAKRIETIAEAGHPEWLADLVNRATVPDDPMMRIQTVAEFRIMLENEGNLP